MAIDAAATKTDAVQTTAAVIVQSSGHSPILIVVISALAVLLLLALVWLRQIKKGQTADKFSAAANISYGGGAGGHKERHGSGWSNASGNSIDSKSSRRIMEARENMTIEEIAAMRRKNRFVSHVSQLLRHLLLILHSDRGLCS